MRNMTELDMYLFGQSTHYDIYKKMGAHPMKINQQEGTIFDVWAPHAKKVWVIGSFNNWDETRHEMKRLEPLEMGIYELFIPGVKNGDMYKYLIETLDGKYLYKADPYATYAELRPGSASIVCDVSHLKWSDQAWMETRAQSDPYGNL